VAKLPVAVQDAALADADGMTDSMGLELALGVELGVPTDGWLGLSR
jgi:hypothetical protein